MAEQLAITATAVLGLLVFVRILGLPSTLAFSAILTTCYLPVVALGEKDQSFSVGIANTFPEWRTYTLFFGISGILLAVRRPTVCIAPSHLLFIGWLVYGILFLWADTPMVYAGALQLLVGILAWSVGASLAQMGKPKSFDQVLIVILAGTAIFEAVICVLQYAGLPINAMNARAIGTLGDRVTGTSNHPNTLGKLMISVLLLLLPLTESRVGKVGRWALLGSGALFVSLGLAQGRTNLAALVSALLIWAVLSPSSRFSSRRMAVIPLTIIGIAATATSVAARFEEDPTGGARGRLLDIATRAVPEKLWSGVGPNSYVTEIAQYYGSYIPVHNAIILLVAEVGLVGATLFLAPIVVAFIRAVPKARINPYARALVATTPGWIAIAWTGWGLLGTSVLPLFMFATAYTASRSKAASATVPVSEDPKSAEEQRNRNRETGVPVPL